MKCHTAAPVHRDRATSVTFPPPMARGTYGRQSFCSQGSGCFEMYWIELAHMFHFLFNAKSIVG